MFHQTDRQSSQSLLRLLSVLVFHLLLTPSCRGESQLIGSPQPLLAGVGDDIILPCHLKPAMDVTAETLEWTRSDLDPRFVHVRRYSQDLVNVQNPSYRGRTSLFIDELKHGNISLKLSRVQLSDQGTYGCDIPLQHQRSSVKLVVASETASSPVISLLGVDRNRGVILNCDSNSWYPEPEVSWLDAEGHVLSAGPTETIRGPDGLYTVSSRVTVEERHRNTFTCRVQQKKTNQTRETQTYIADDFFKLQSSSSALTAGLAVSLSVCILIILLLVFLVWRQNRIKTKRGHRDETDEGEKKSRFTRHKTEDQLVTEEEREREPLRTDRTVEMKVLNKEKEKKTKCLMKQQQKEQQLRREEAENRVKELEEELETKKNQLKTKQAELQQLHEEKQRNEEELRNLKEQLENKNKEVETLRDKPAQFSRFSLFSDKRNDQRRKEEAEHEVETLKKKLETHEKELNTKNKEIEDKQAEVQQLQDVIQRMETNLQSNKLESTQAAPVQSSSSPVKWPIVSRQKLQDEQQRRDEAENKVQMLEERLQTLSGELRDEQRWKEQAEKEVQTKGKELQESTDQLQQEKWKSQKAQREITTLKNQLEFKNNKFPLTPYTLFKDEQQGREKAEREVQSLKNQVNKLTVEKQRCEKEQQQLKMELESKKKEVDRLMADVKRLTVEKQSNEIKQQQLKNELETKTKELHDEKQKQKEAETQTKELLIKNMELTEEKQKCENEQKKLQMELETKKKEVESLKADVKRLTEEKQK